MQRVIPVLLSFALLAAAAPAAADQNDPRLNELFARLQKTDNRLEAQTLESMIWGIWYSSEDVEVSRLMDQGERAMQAQDMRTAHRRLHQDHGDRAGFRRRLEPPRHRALHDRRI